MTKFTPHPDSSTFKRLPLVSVVVVTYNSSETVLETLQSIKDQSYEDIELIISDDCSSDNTVAICKEWLGNNKSAFTSTALVTTKTNTGVPGNCNRGLQEASGEWIKGLAGDDLLFPDCIENLVDYVIKNPDVKFCFTNYVSYKDSFQESNRMEENIEYSQNAQMFSRLNVSDQLEVVKRTIPIHSPTLFYKKDAMIQVGGWEEKYRLVEDWPTLPHILRKNFKIHYFDIETIKYRIHSKSITSTTNLESTIPKFATLGASIIKDNFKKDYSLKEKILFFFEYHYYSFYSKSSVKSNLISRIYRRVWYYLTDLSIKSRRGAILRYYKRSKTYS